MRKITALALALGVLATPMTQASASPALSKQPDLTRVYPGESYSQWRPRYYHGPRHYYGPPRYYYRRDSGAAVAAGVAGVAAGALIAGAIANSQAQAAAVPPPPATVDPQLAAWCARKYRSFDAMTGTYLAVSGERIVCTYR
jgi:hypothetical protein